MTQGDHDSVVGTDPHALLFGHDDEHVDARPDGHGDGHPGVPQDNGGAPYRPTRSESRGAHRSQRRKAGRRRAFVTLALAALVIVGLSLWFIGRPIYDARFHPKDYSGQGTGSVVIKVNAGDDASDIAKTLVKDKVVASTRAFTNAASKNSKSKFIQPGAYQLRKHMSASNAVTLMLDPKSRVSTRVLVPEGATEFDVIKSLSTSLRMSPATVRSQLSKASDLGLPNTYRNASGGAPATVEGFLYPATYSFDPGTSVSDAANEMINAFIDQDRSSGFSAKAQKLKISPYEALIMASIAQSEAKFPADMAKVARVIINRIAVKMPLQIDATSAYGAKVNGADPSKITYATYPSPYNSYTHDGLPPTPISNPGAEAMNAATAPPTGNWLYYVNSDAAGHLFFTNDPHAFETAVDKCRTHHWGCG